MEVINITAYPDDSSQIEAIKAIFKAMKIKFELSGIDENESNSPYDVAFVEKIKKSKKEYEEGNFITVDKKDIDSFLGL